MKTLARVAGLALALLGCGRHDRAAVDDPAAGREPPDLAGLGAALDRDLATLAGADDRRAAATALIDSWRVPAAVWPTLVTERFRPNYPAYADAFAAARPALAEALASIHGPVDVRWQYADDPLLAPDQARLRIALPVGRPGAIVTVAGRPLSPDFVHDGRRWRALTGLDQVIVRRLAARMPACVAPYQAAARPPCLAMSAPVIDAALADDAAELERACTRLRVNGCGDE